MLDRRFKHSLRIKNPFLLYKKYKKSGIFYVRFENGKTISTHSTNNQSSNNVERIYFVSDKADMSKVYDEVIKAFDFVLK